MFLRQILCFGLVSCLCYKKTVLGLCLRQCKEILFINCDQNGHILVTILCDQKMGVGLFKEHSKTMRNRRNSQSCVDPAREKLKTFSRSIPTKNVLFKGVISFRGRKLINSMFLIKGVLNKRLHLTSARDMQSLTPDICSASN